MADLDTYVESAKKALHDKGYVGVTKYIDSKEQLLNGQVKKLLKSYDKENHIARIKYRYVADILGFSKDMGWTNMEDSPDHKALYDAKITEIANDDDQNLKLATFLKDTLDRYERSNQLGRMVH